MLRRVKLLALVVIISFMISAQTSTNQAAPVPPPNNCVGIASDSNGFGHVTFQLPPVPDGQVGIIYVRPFDVVLRPELDALSLTYLAVSNRSLTASSLTASERTNYIKSAQYGNLIKDRCKFVIVGPFIPDVAAAVATPEQYTSAMLPLVGGLVANNPQTTVFILSFYQTERADFTADNNGYGMRADRIDAFNQRLGDYCQSDKPLGRIPQVMCVNTQAVFAGLGTSYLLTDTTRDQFFALVFRQTGFRPTVEQFFAQHPEASIIGDGIHLSLEGRIALMQHMARMIAKASDF